MTSSRIVLAIALKPWPLISSFDISMRRSAAKMALSLIGRAAVRALGNTYRPAPVNGWISWRMASAWVDNGTM